MKNSGVLVCLVLALACGCVLGQKSEDAFWLNSLDIEPADAGDDLFKPLVGAEKPLMRQYGEGRTLLGVYDGNCFDSIKNGDETAMDCGGRCRFLEEPKLCGTGQGCGIGPDCMSGVCSGGICQTATCSDKVKNGLEADVDCGVACPGQPCANGKTCSLGADCESGSCLNGICTSGTCFDQVQNQDETDVDCGGTCLSLDPPRQCGINRKCKIGADCASLVCGEDGRCKAPSCVPPDGIKNGQETDVDCGGGAGCPTCGDGKACAIWTDCSNGICEGGKCQSGSCYDGKQNGDETGVDCGGSCLNENPPKTCPVNVGCGNPPVPANCATGVCAPDASGRFVCQWPTCSDGILNGRETDVDCGGPVSTDGGGNVNNCKRCDVGQKCLLGSDCGTGRCISGTCEAPTCSDGVKNNEETDVDCGGPNCRSLIKCGIARGCVIDDDCASGKCTAGLCAAPQCKTTNGQFPGDGVKNGLETDIDCGGGAGCVPCENGKVCTVWTDCTSGICKDGICTAPSCDDGKQNGEETSVDCGGPTCRACNSGQTCTLDRDCVSGFCNPTLSPPRCSPPSCTDGVKNGWESDVDCGGACNTKCAVGQTCNRGLDCELGVCTSGTCSAASCTDGIKNGLETDIDCGGGTCPSCRINAMCKASSDCSSLVCDPVNLRCSAPTCSDGVKNGQETAIDCGGSCITKCNPGEGCLKDTDCASRSCNTGVNPPVCKGPTCSDNLWNGDETAKDCGGSCPNKCATFQACKINADCQSGVCDTGLTGTFTCQFPTCSDTVKNGQEADVDCGLACPGQPCGEGKTCIRNNDCATNICTGGVCKAASCTDNAKNGDETDVDCGGSCPTKCGANERCDNADGVPIGSNCVSGVCSATTKLCQVARCDDGVQNGLETDVDCGGNCPKCAATKKCKIWTDCASNNCENIVDGIGTCSGPTCSDKIFQPTANQETALDCGGPICAEQFNKKCNTFQGCAAGRDCKSGVCTGSECQPPSCTDSVRNGYETAVDCGGGICKKCPNGETCYYNSDCTSGNCVGANPGTTYGNCAA